jgi:urease accessory protein
MKKTTGLFWGALASALLASTPAFAHLDPLEHGSFAAGFSHPLFGFDHILAMVGVGLWASVLSGRAIWAVPSAFVATMLLGFAVSMPPIPLPFVEPVIAASVVVLGLLALVAVQAPASVAAGMVAIFALFHGYAHGSELGEAGAVPFMAGFALATAALHALGLAGGLIAGRFAGPLAARVAGGFVALGGFWIAVGS